MLATVPPGQLAGRMIDGAVELLCGPGSITGASALIGGGTGRGGRPRLHGQEVGAHVSTPFVEPTRVGEVVGVWLPRSPRILVT